MNQGSGTTPTLLGDYVAITDNADPINVAVYRRRDGKQIRRQPVFEKGTGSTDNSLIGAGHSIIVENNYSGQFARYLRSETGIAADGHIRKYDGEPFMPHHIVNGVREQLAVKTKNYVPEHEVMV